MVMANVLIDDMWKRIQEIFDPLITVVKAFDNDIFHLIGNSSNDSFLLGAYLSFMKDRDGDEVTISVDVKNKNSYALIESDISKNDGKIIAEGPEIECELTKENIDEWLEKFEQFLQENYDSVKRELTTLDS